MTLERQLGGSPILFKKIDSLFRGQVLPEIRPFLAHGRYQKALLVPQNPSMGRTIQAGIYRVAGRPLDETEFSRDPAFPASSGSPLDLVERSGTDSVGLLEARDILPRKGIFIGEADTMEAMAYWAGQVDGDTLAVGGSDFLEALLDRQPDRIAEPSSMPHGKAVPPIRFYVSGSTTEFTHQVFSTMAGEGIQVDGLPADRLLNSPSTEQLKTVGRLSNHLAKGESVALRILPPRISGHKQSAAILNHFTQAATAIIRAHPPLHVYVEGGATAASLLGTLGWTTLSVAKVWGKGAVTLEVGKGGSESYFVSMKPSSFPWPPGFGPSSKPFALHS